MRLVVDALAARFGGTAAMAAQVSVALARRDDVQKVLLLEERGSVIPQHLEETPELTMMLVSVPGRLRLPVRLAWEALRLPSLLERFHATAILTFSGMLPRDVTPPVVSMLVNALPFDRSNAGNFVRRLAIERTSRRSRAVIVPTKYMAGFMSDHPNVGVVPYGVDRDMFSPVGAPGNEILYVSDFYAHKRHDLAIRAWERLPKPRPLLRFVGNGSVDPHVYARVGELVEASGPGIVMGGEYVPLPTLLEAYRRARIVIMPSEHESFSMPLAEAVCMGLPVVARDHPVMRETAGAGALYVQGDDQDQWASAMGRLLSNSDEFAELRVAALRHSERFSWDAMAAEVVQRLQRA